MPALTFAKESPAETIEIFKLQYHNHSELLRPGKRPKIKRAASQLFAELQKRQRLDKELQEQQAAAPEWSGEYTTLDHMMDTPMAKTVLKGLRKKNVDITYLCGEVCAAAVKEGSMRYETKVLSGIQRESRFHARLAKDLPKVTVVRLPIQIRKKLRYKKFRPLSVSQATLFSFMVFPKTQRT